MLQNLKKWFTLIELLVVITIIGILATWAVSVYTSQIAKARDSTRISDVKVIETAVVQASSDIWYFPTPLVDTAGATDTFWSATAPYLNEIPTDPRSGQDCNGSGCDYMYATGNSAGTLPNHSSYEISTAFESDANVTSKAATDATGAGTDPLRMEFGDRTITTTLTPAQAANSDDCRRYGGASAYRLSIEWVCDIN